jgi:hypothetical protein
MDCQKLEKIFINACKHKVNKNLEIMHTIDNIHIPIQVNIKIIPEKNNYNYIHYYNYEKECEDMKELYFSCCQDKTTNC